MLAAEFVKVVMAKTKTANLNQKSRIMKNIFRLFLLLCIPLFFGFSYLKKYVEHVFNESHPNAKEKTLKLDKTTLTERDLVTGINLPWDISWGPDDHVWVTERGGRVLRVDPETGAYKIALDHTETVVDGAERGMFGLVHHPNWQNYKRVYIVYTIGDYKQGTARELLSVFDWKNGKLVNEKTLLDFPAYMLHNGSRLVISPDGKLLMSTGEIGLEEKTAQNLESLNGKILRINLDGSIPDDNPYPNSYVYSYGHRNPQGLAVGKNNIIYSSEHGNALQDEFNIITPKGNYGWPFVEGIVDLKEEKKYVKENEVVEPIMEWLPSQAHSGIEYYDHPVIPEWRHSVLVASLGGMRGLPSYMSILHLSEDGMQVTENEKRLTELKQRIRDICVNPHTGAVYVALNGANWPGEGPNVIKEYRNDAYQAPGH